MSSPVFNFPAGNIWDGLNEAAARCEFEQYPRLYLTLPFPSDVELGWQWHTKCRRDEDRVQGDFLRFALPIPLGPCVHMLGTLTEYLEDNLINGDQDVVWVDPTLYGKERVYISRGLVSLTRLPPFDDSPSPPSLMIFRVRGGNPRQFEEESPDTKPQAVVCSLRSGTLRMAEILGMIVQLQWATAQRMYGWEGAAWRFMRLRVTAIRRSVAKDGTTRFFPQLEVLNPRHPHWAQNQPRSLLPDGYLQWVSSRW
ncbi:hypothetical protein BD310DRAFT_935223 [Dichomitus squalens]|uniref:Uncharacterized protein n=1 Tax=Dichomitus squalens TaxID=114155 RepID=A0A4Q9PKU4_9APHY|nr:hypothetical protein BD310DRAFT_935223 [Dichomitus squalens]